MFPSRMMRWLGYGQSPVALGVHLTTELATVIAVRAEPLRLVAVGREIVFDAAVVHDEARLARSLAQDLRELVTRLRLPTTALAVVTVDPAVARIIVRDTGTGQEPYCDVDRAAHDRMAAVVRLAGLRLVRIDPVPIALARLARLVGDESVALRAPSRWSVVTGPGYVEAEWVDRAPADDSLLIGPDLGSLQPIRRLKGIKVPSSLAKSLEPGRDGPAIGAALAGLGFPPLVIANPVSRSIDAAPGALPASTVPPGPETAPPPHERT